MLTASSTATPNKSEASDENETEQSEDCNQGGEPDETGYATCDRQWS
jgi:hypothetical protein